MTRSEEIEKVELTPEEHEQAILDAKIKKYFHEKNKEYWQELESRKAEKGQTGLRAKAGSKAPANE